MSDHPLEHLQQHVESLQRTVANLVVELNNLRQTVVGMQMSEAANRSEP